jgi:transposase
MKNTCEKQKKIDYLEAQLSLKDQRIHSLEELVQFFKNQKFAPSSEKVSVNQLGLFNEAESVEAENIADVITTEDVVVKAHHRTKKPRISIPDSLPRENIDYDLPESERFCPHDNTPLTRMGTEDHEQLDIIPAQVKVIRHRRAKYRCSCCNQYHITASKPKQPIEKGIASAGLLAYIATQKYCDALPLYRQSDIFKRSGIHLDRTNLANWMIRCGTLVQPLINLLQERVLERPVIHMDETPLQVLSEPDKTAQSKSYMWLMASFLAQPIVIFHYTPTRRREVVMQLLDRRSECFNGRWL